MFSYQSQKPTSKTVIATNLLKHTQSGGNSVCDDIDSEAPVRYKPTTQGSKHDCDFLKLDCFWRESRWDISRKQSFCTHTESSSIVKVGPPISLKGEIHPCKDGAYPAPFPQRQPIICILTAELEKL